MVVGKKTLAKIADGVGRYRGILAAARKRDVSESDTVVMIGDMLADILGYEKYLEISTEFAVKGTFVDLCVKVGSEVNFLIEAKAIGVELKDHHVRQAVDYGANQGIEWAILTNGVVWRIYHIEFKKPLSHTLVAEVDLLTEDAGKTSAIEFFANLCKEGFAKSQMEEFFEHRQATNKHALAAVMLTDDMLNEVRLALRRLFPGVRVDPQALEYSLRNDVIKRELIDGEEAAVAANFVKKAARAAARNKARSKAAVEQSAPAAPTPSGAQPVSGTPAQTS